MGEKIKNESGIATITKRFVISVSACALVYWSLRIHRGWVWCYFESIMAYPTATPELANVATASISAITTAFIAGSSSIAFIVAFFVTGNVLALQSMFKWTTTAQAVGETVAQSINERMTQDITERIIAPKHFDSDDIP